MDSGKFRAFKTFKTWRLAPGRLTNCTPVAFDFADSGMVDCNRYCNGFLPGFSSLLITDCRTKDQNKQLTYDETLPFSDHDNVPDDGPWRLGSGNRGGKSDRQFRWFRTPRGEYPREGYLKRIAYRHKW